MPGMLLFLRASRVSFQPGVDPFGLQPNRAPAAEAAYLAAWSALPRSGPHVEFIDRWSSEPFASYVASLLELAERFPHEAAQEHFNLVLAHERDFWTMSWKREI